MSGDFILDHAGGPGRKSRPSCLFLRCPVEKGSCRQISYCRSHSSRLFSNQPVSRPLSFNQDR